MFEEQFRPHANVRPMNISLQLEEEIDSRDVTKPGCNSSYERIYRLAEPVEHYGRTNRFVIRCNYATGFKHKLCEELPDWVDEE